MDSNGELSKDELVGMLNGFFHQGDCPKKNSASKIDSNSQILGEQHVAQFEEWLGGQFELKLAYKSQGNKCDSLDWHSKVDGLKPTLTVAKTAAGKVLGGYLSFAWNAVDTYKAYPTKFADSEAWIFSLDEASKFKVLSAYASTASQFYPSMKSERMIEWGWEVLILGNTSDKKCQMYSDPADTKKQYGSTLTQPQFTGITSTNSAWVPLAALETFTVTLL